MSTTESQIRQEMLRLFGEGPAEGDIIRADTPAWDSLKHVDLIFLLEEVFDVQFSTEEMERADRLSTLTALVEQRRAP